MEEQEEESVINLVDVLNALLRKWWVIAIAAVIGTLFMLGYTFFNTKQFYDATVMLYVNVNDGISLNGYSFSLSDLNASRSLVSTYSVIAKREETLLNVLDAARVYDEAGKVQSLEQKYAKQGKELHEVYSVKYLTDKITVASVNNTEIFYIKVSTTDADDSMALANAFLEIFPDEVSSIIKGTDAKPVHTATGVDSVSRGFARNMVIGFAAGAVLAAAVIFVLDVMINDTIDTADWLKDAFKEEVPLLTIVPEADEHGRYGYYRGYGRYGRGYGYGYGYYYGDDEKAKGDGEVK